MSNTKSYPTTNFNKYHCQHQFAINRIGTFLDNLTQLITLIKPSYIFNIGCGEGLDIKNIYEKGEINIEYCCGLDLNFDALKIARQMSTNVKFDAIKGDIYYLPSKLNRFDLILCLEVLEHLTFPGKALKEISHHFNGYCIFSVPNEPLYRLTRLLLFKQNIRQLGNHPEHLNHWSKNKFSRLLRKYFIIDKLVTPFPWTIVLCHKKEE